MTRLPGEGDWGLATVLEAAHRAGVRPKTIRSWVDRYELTVWREPRQPMMVSMREILAVERSTRRNREARGGPARQSEVDHAE